MDLRLTLLPLFLLLTGCVGIPTGIEPVRDFNINRYLGTWYEVARLDHSFERGLSKVTATYTLRKDGGISVLNLGYSSTDNRWRQAEGKAYFVGKSDTAYLKVSFFGPFYGSYIVFDLDNEYQHAMVSGPNKSYFWILSRTPEIDKATLQQLLDKAEQLGFDTDKLIYPLHNGQQSH
ncbi:lipocalin family protein [Spongorhabdus nitratireducens]